MVKKYVKSQFEESIEDDFDAVYEKLKNI